jgi:hypothetical protein
MEANMESSEPVFTCIKCEDDVEYSEFAEAPHPRLDYGYYVIQGDINPVGVRIVDGVDLCSLCVRVINVGKGD